MTGRGSIEVLPSGRHCARMPDTTRLGTFDTREEASAVLDAAICELTSGRVEPKNVRSFKTAGPEWLDECELAGSRDMPTNRSRWTEYMPKAPFYELALKRITPAMCFEWRQALRFAVVRYPYKQPRNGKRISGETAERIFSLASTFMQNACDSGWVSSNPFHAAGKPKTKKARTHDPSTYLEWSRVPVQNEQARLLAAIPDEDERLIAECVMLGGHRTSEDIWMPLDDVHLDAVDDNGTATPYIIVRYSRGQGARKSGEWYRQDLIKPAADAWDRWLKRLPAYAPKNPRGLVFPRRDGRPRQSGKVFGEYTGKDGKKHTPWHDWVRAAGIKRVVRVYDLRHTCATSLLCGWWGRRWSLIEIQSYLGHMSSVSTKRYAHLAREAEQRAARETRGGISSSPTGLPRAYARGFKMSAMPMKSLVGPAGLEPATYGLKVRSSTD
jgi:hypothetical protein